MGDADALRQVILNIIKNAVEAIPQSSGQISIRTRLTTNFRIKEVREKKSTRLVMTEIRDNGIGISKENLEKIFTPFFTTKQSGVGLGMAIAQRVIDEHGGIIQFLSEKEQGTTVRLFLRSCL
ncbi:MAG: hypothetical protein HY073_01475 [Deltaproteobacteria bacterium]|nr:hypothetical protein [Deltaproteobacteria bacterium]